MLLLKKYSYSKNIDKPRVTGILPSQLRLQNTNAGTCTLTTGEKPQKSTNWNEYIFLECLDFPNGPVATELRPADDSNKMKMFIGIPKIQ